METNYDEQAQTFLSVSGTEFSARKTGVVLGFPFEDDGLPHDRYSVTLKRDGKEYKFPFYNSAYAHRHGKKLKPYDVLTSLICYEVPDNMWDFAKEFGYIINDQHSFDQTRKTWLECRKQYRKLYDLFGPYFMGRLAEIQ